MLSEQLWRIWPVSRDPVALANEIGDRALEAFLDEALDDRLVMVFARSGPTSPDYLFEVPYADIDWDLLIYWPRGGDPIRVDFTFDPEAPALVRLDDFDVDQQLL